ncbi:MFS transporter [Arthrobacter sp. H14]|uniref:MFS transporter n=1 Tax=Arthrobacter sp. H14 TaxID=1312959 RepID=UPI0004797286|nr:MFS transporter [Arthrobacter sp. H14]
MKGIREGTKRLIGPFTDVRSRRLLAAFLVSELGDGITAVVVPLGVYAVSDSVVALASTFLGRMLVGSLFAAAGGMIADSMDRRLLLLISYVFRAALVAALIPLADWSPAAFAVIGVLVGAAGSFDNPAAESALRASYRHDLQSLAAARKSGKAVSQMIGPAVGGLLFGVGGLSLALAVNVLTFVIALLLLAAKRTMTSDGGRAPAAGKAGFKAASKIARYRGQLPPVVSMAFFSAAAASFLVAVATVLAVPYLADLPNAPAGAYGFALAAYSIGALTGLWLAGIRSWAKVRLKSILVFSAIAFGAITVLSVSAPRWEIFAAAWFIWGIAFGPEDVVSDSRVASIVADRWLARVYAAWSILGKLGAAAGYGLIVVIGDLDAQSALLTIGMLYAALVPVLLLLFPKERETPVRRGAN